MRVDDKGFEKGLGNRIYDQRVREWDAEVRGELSRLRPKWAKDKADQAKRKKTMKKYKWLPDFGHKYYGNEEGDELPDFYPKGHKQYDPEQNAQYDISIERGLPNDLIKDRDVIFQMNEAFEDMTDDQAKEFRDILNRPYGQKLGDADLLRVMRDISGGKGEPMTMEKMRGAQKDFEDGRKMDTYNSLGKEDQDRFLLSDDLYKKIELKEFSNQK